MLPCFFFPRYLACALAVPEFRCWLAVATHGTADRLHRNVLRGQVDVIVGGKDQELPDISLQWYCTVPDTWIGQRLAHGVPVRAS